MAEVNLGGKKFPLCLTVSALEEVTQKCGSLDKLLPWLNSGDNSDIFHHYAWALDLLIREGEAHRAAVSLVNGSGGDTRYLPPQETIIALMTPGQFPEIRMAVLQALKESLTRSIEAEPAKSKNVNHAEQ